MQAIPHSRLALTPEAQSYVTAGKSPEVVVFDAVPAEGGEMAAVQQTVEKPIWALGFKKAMEKRWIKMDKQDGKQLLTRQTQAAEDTCLASLRKVAAEEEVDSKAVAELKKRKLVKVEQWKTFKVSKGPAFSLERVKQETDLTVELLQGGEWRNRKFKEYNFEVRSPAPRPGRLHACICNVRPHFSPLHRTLCRAVVCPALGECHATAQVRRRAQHASQPAPALLRLSPVRRGLTQRPCYLGSTEVLCHLTRSAARVLCRRSACRRRADTCTRC